MTKSQLMAHRVLCTFLLAFSSQALSQGFRIEKATVDSTGNLRLEFSAETNSYYVLERAESLVTAMEPISMVLPLTANAVLQQPVDRARAFFRLHAIPLAAPLDTDQDGIDDAYELRRQPLLNPLDPSDAGNDPDGNGLTHLQEYRAAQFDQGKHRIAAGDHHFLALKSDGTLWACGQNRFGQLGDGTTNNSAELILIEPDFRWQAVAAGGLRSYGIRMDGSLWAWGLSAGYAPLGDGSFTNHLRPTRVGHDTDWKLLAVSPGHTMAIKQDGSLWGWGYNSIPLGDGSEGTNRPTPIRIGTETNWAEVAVGQNLTLALREDGQLFACGFNDGGQLGIGTTNSYANVPTPVASNFIWQAIGAGDFQGLGIRSDHTLWAWGQLVEDSVFGHPYVTNRFGPTQIGTNSNWLRVLGGYQHAVSFDTDGALWSFGINSSGEVGEGTQQPRSHPTRIAAADRWLSADAKDGNHLGIRVDGTLWNWSTANGQVVGSIGMFKPVMPERRFRSVAAGDYHSVAIDDSGSVWTWGANESGELGDGSTDFGLPRRIVTNIVATSVSAGGKHSLAIDYTNQLWMWGAVAYGQSSWGASWPINFAWFSTNAWAMADGGGLHWLGLDSQGNLLAFGDDSQHQQPGESSHTNQYVTISAGGWSSFAIDRDGFINMWGQFVPACCLAHAGRLSTCTSNFQSVIAGAQHALAIRVDGTLWSMGDNTWGQLGIGTNSYPCMEKPVMTNFTWKSAAAYYHNLAIRADGTLWFWGYDGNSAITRTPIQISTNTTWQVVAAGYQHSLALQEDGSLWAWGHNDYGQLGLTPFRQYTTETTWKPPPPK